MKLVFVGALCAMVTGCSSQKPAAAPPARASAHAAVVMAADIWNATASACMEVAESKSDDSVRMKCAEVLLPAHDSIEAAANAVDSWTAADQANYPCLMLGVSDGLAQIEKIVPGLVGGVPSIVTDGLALSRSIGASCNMDGGK